MGRRCTAAVLALVLGATMRAESNTIPAAPPGVVETGAPSFAVLGPESLGLSSPPRDLTIMPDGRLIAVSEREIAIGDGVRWEVFRAAEGERATLNQIAVDRDGQIYSGIPGGIARVEFEASGRWRLPLLVALPAGAASARATMNSVTMVAGQWYWHAGGGGVLVWRPGQTPQLLNDLPVVERIFAIGDDVFVRDAGSGVVVRMPKDNASPRVTVSTSAESMTMATTFSPGVGLVGMRQSGLTLFDGKEFRPFATNGWVAGNRITDLMPAGKDHFVAAVDSFGMVFFDRSGRAVQVLDRALDHRLGRVRRIVGERNGVIWGLLNEGVVRVEFPSPISSFAPLITTGLTYAQPLRHQGKLWVHTDGRVMRGIYTAGGRLERFEEDTPPGGYIYTIKVIDDRLFATSEVGIFVHEDGAWRMAVEGIFNARLITRPQARGWPYVARGEVGFLRRTASGYVAERIPMPQLPQSYNAVVDGAGVIWLELGTGAAGRVDTRGAQPSVRLFGQADGLTRGWVEVYLFEGIARIHLPNRLWRYDEATQQLIDDRELLQRLPTLASADGRPMLDRQGRLWHTLAGSARLLEPDGRGGYNDRLIANNFPSWEYTLQEDDVVWMFTDRRLSRVDLRIARPAPEPLKTLVTSVQYPATNRRVFNPGASLPALDAADNSLVVYFSAPANPFAGSVSFEVMLEGAGTRWVSTGAVGLAAFNQLKEGRYVFRARPVVGGKPAGEEARLAFTVRPPWFRTPLAWGFYVVTALGLFAFSAWLSAFLQRREKQRLALLVAERTEELSRQIQETTEKSTALAVSEERFRTLNTELEARVHQRTAELSLSNSELQQRESLFRLIFEHAPVGLYWKRADLGDAYHLNATFRRILALPGDTLPSQAPLASLVHPDDAERLTEAQAGIAAGEQDSFELESRFVVGEDRIVWGALSVAVVRDARGRVVQDIGILEDISARKRAEDELTKTYKNLVDASRLAGMAEVATGVLHNVGNVLNSLNVSSNSITTRLHRSKAANLVKLSSLVHEHIDHLGDFVQNDPKGRLVPNYLESVAQHSLQERDWLLQEVASMQNNIDHIKEIVAMQQGYSKAIGVVEVLEASALFEDAMRMNSASLVRHDVRVERDFARVPRISLEKGKVLQILVNLIRNAKHACDDARKGRPGDKVITLRIEPAGEERVRFIVGDNGVGIAPENLTRIFSHGFTTRQYGHGYGLHSSALAARDMGGSLTVQSAGPGQGAQFTLELPLVAKRAAGEVDEVPRMHAIVDTEPPRLPVLLGRD